MLPGNYTDEPHRLITSSIRMVIPCDKCDYGYLSQHHSYGLPDDKASGYTEDFAETMFATTREPVQSRDRLARKRTAVQNQQFDNQNDRQSTQSSKGDKNGLWKTVYVAAVFVS